MCWWLIERIIWFSMHLVFPTFFWNYYFIIPTSAYVNVFGPQKGRWFGSLYTYAKRKIAFLDFVFFRSLYENYSEKLEHKIKCVIHYFERIRLHMPTGFVSFERKILPWDCCPLQVSYPDANFWSKSLVPLCQFQVRFGCLSSIKILTGFELIADFIALFSLWIYV